MLNTGFFIIKHGFLMNILSRNMSPPHPISDIMNMLNNTTTVVIIITYRNTSKKKIYSVNNSKKTKLYRYMDRYRYI